MVLGDRIRIARRYQRAIRIDTDIGDPAALDGFICPRSSADVLETMARHVAGDGQGAFTWTGPYGSGKSSLVVVLSAALNGNRWISRNAESIIGSNTAALLKIAFPRRTRGWRILPVVGRRARPAQVIGEAISETDFLTEPMPKSWTDKRVLDALDAIARRNPRAGGGLMVFIDEMGKFLEAAAKDRSDIYLFQELAERASRSDKRLIVVGILHQAFEEYAHRLSREMRNEWSKIQGRFVDQSVNTSGDEQIDLLSRAIETDYHPKKSGSLAEGIAGQIQRQTSPYLVNLLEDCWPLHPIVACLLGPISRRRFGQNQRSIFGFLNSSEPQGFQDFLLYATDEDLYGPDRLWDYLRINLEPSILASPDGHRWALATDALEKCESKGGEDLHIRLLKVIAVVDMFKDGSGIYASPDLLRLAFSGHEPDEIECSLTDLQRWSFLIYRKFTGAYRIFEGSDFDINHAVEYALESLGELDLALLNGLASLRPIVAKRHYHDTGALRWFDLEIVPVTEIQTVAENYEPTHGAIGSFFLTIPTQGESLERARKICEHAAQGNGNRDVIVGLSERAWGIPTQMRELAALKQVSEETPELRDDKVARLEIQARLAALEGQLESELVYALNSAFWYCKHVEAEVLPHAELNRLASRLANDRFKPAPRLHNELLSRIKPSSTAVAARNALLRRMVLREGEKRLGIEGFPAEGGLFVSLLEGTGLYRETEEGWRFVAPGTDENGPQNLAPTWRAATKLLKTNAHRAVPISEIYDVWHKEPFGIKEGLLPVLAVAYLLSQHSSLALYQERIFRSHLTDLDVDNLAKDPTCIQLRWMNLSGASRRLLSEMADIVRDLDEKNKLNHLAPIDVARGLVAIYDRIPPWASRTQRLSCNAKRIRQLFKKANDPNRLIFNDIPEIVNEGSVVGEAVTIDQVSDCVREGLIELRLAYPTMLNRMRETLLAELQVPNASPSMLAELRVRAENIRGLGGDHRFEAFIVRLARFKGSEEDMEGLAGMAVNKPPRDWVDPDIDRATVELADMAQRFLRAEAFARVKGRQDKRHALAMVIGMDGQPKLVHGEFEITDLDQPEVKALIEQVKNTIRRKSIPRRNIILAALAELSAQHLDSANTTKRMSTGINSREKKKAIS